MRRLVSISAAALIFGLAAHAGAADFTDSAGRTVAVPDHVERVFAAGPREADLPITLADVRL